MFFGRFVGGGDDGLVIGIGTEVEISGCIEDGIPDGKENYAGSFRGGNIVVADGGVRARVLTGIGGLGAGREAECERDKQEN